MSTPGSVPLFRVRARQGGKTRRPRLNVLGGGDDGHKSWETHSPTEAAPVRGSRDLCLTWDSRRGRKDTASARPTLSSEATRSI